MTSQKPTFRFPKKFMWGVSISAHQTEGGNHNNWSVWELEHARTLAAQAQYHYGDLESWDRVKDDALDANNYVSGDGSRHYDMYALDFDIAKKMNMNTFRFSVEWSRIEPQEGVWDAGAIEHYKRYINEMKKRGLEPIVTLLHYTLPVWFVEKRGFEKRSNVKYFTRYAEKIISELGSPVRTIITINEPEIYVTESYFHGVWPPNQHRILKGVHVINNLILAHNRTADMLHAMNRRYKVSIAKSSAYYYAGDDAWLSKRTAGLLQWVQDDYILKRVAKRCDYIGLNYYFANRVYGYRIHNPDERLSDLGWDMNPQILQQTLERLHDKYNLPIIITENGLADGEDKDRRWWLSHTIVAMQKALEYGVDLRGYIHWSLIDNFEWDKGRWPRFGLIEIDYKTYKRKPRPSAIWYAGVLKKLQKED